MLPQESCAGCARLLPIDRHPLRRYCSKNCQNRAWCQRQPAVVFTCQRCGRTVSRSWNSWSKRRKYCSMRCSGQSIESVWGPKRDAQRWRTICCQAAKEAEDHHDVFYLSRIVWNPRFVRLPARASWAEADLELHLGKLQRHYPRRHNMRHPIGPGILHDIAFAALTRQVVQSDA